MQSDPSPAGGAGAGRADTGGVRAGRVDAADRGLDHAVQRVERDAQALMAVFLQAVSGVEGRASAAQLRVLSVLRDRGPLNLGDLADALGIRPSSATRLCDRLSAAGLLLREVAPHSRREVVLSVSRPGLDLLVELEQWRCAQIRQVLAGVPDADRQALVTGLGAFAAAAVEPGDGRLTPATRLDGRNV